MIKKDLNLFFNLFASYKLKLDCKIMLADFHDYLAVKDPAGSGSPGVIVVDGTIGRIHPSRASFAAW